MLPEAMVDSNSLLFLLFAAVVVVIISSFTLRVRSHALVRSEVLLAKVVRCRRVQLRGEDLHVGKGGHDHPGGDGRAEQVGQDDGRLGDAVVAQHVDGLQAEGRWVK